MSRVKETKRLYNIDFLRFVFAVIIVYHHLLHDNIIKATGGTDYFNSMAESWVYAGAIVECFFILAGYFLYKTYYKRPDLSVKEFTYKKIARLWPVLFIYCLLNVFVFKTNPYTSFYNVLFLQCIGVSTEYQGINWYISPFFWTLIFYFVLLKCVKNKKHLNIAIGLICYFSYVFLVNYSSGRFGRETVGFVFNLGLLRALGGIGVGYLTAFCLESIKKMPSIICFSPTKMQSAAITAVITVLEAVSIAALMINFIGKENADKNQFFAVIMFVLLLVCMLSQKGVISRVFNRKIFGTLGKYSYSIYVMQQIAFWTLRDVFWQKNISYIQQHGLRTLLISLVFSVALGIVTYYVVEKPAAALFKKMGKRIFLEKQA